MLPVWLESTRSNHCLRTPTFSIVEVIWRRSGSGSRRGRGRAVLIGNGTSIKRVETWQYTWVAYNFVLATDLRTKDLTYQKKNQLRPIKPWNHVAVFVNQYRNIALGSLKCPDNFFFFSPVIIESSYAKRSNPIKCMSSGRAITAGFGYIDQNLQKVLNLFSDRSPSILMLV